MIRKLISSHPFTLLGMCVCMFPEGGFVNSPFIEIEIWKVSQLPPAYFMHKKEEITHRDSARKWHEHNSIFLFLAAYAK